MKLFSSKKKKKGINLCLSGGGALGFAHIGVIQALEEYGIYPTQIAGTSIGAVIGVFYAGGYSPEYMLKSIKDNKLYKITNLLTFQPSFWKRGLSDHTTLRKLVKELIPHNSFEGLERKFYVGVSNMYYPKYEIISTGGDLDKWVAASASIPSVFEPIIHDDIFYIDGGVMNNMPAQCFEKDYRNTIGVDVLPYHSLKLPEAKRALDIVLSSVRAMQHQNSQEGRDICIYLIEPSALEKYHEFSFEHYEEISKIGYNTAIEYIKNNRDILNLAKK